MEAGSSWVFFIMERALLHSHINRDSFWVWICLPHSPCFFHHHRLLTQPGLLCHLIISEHRAMLLINTPSTAKGPRQRTSACGIYVPVTQKQLSGVRLKDIAKCMSSHSNKNFSPIEMPSKSSPIIKLQNTHLKV